MSKSDGRASEDGRPLLRATGLVLVKSTKKGRGVFATEPISRSTIIDICPVLIFNEDEVEQHTSKTILQHYTYYWPSESGRSMIQALALGLGSMFNHSVRAQNVGWTRDIQSDCIIYTALRDIKEGEELCISYGSARLWFEDADGPIDDDGANDDIGGQTLGEIELSGLGKMSL